MAEGEEQCIVWEWIDDQNSWQRYSPKISKFIEENRSAAWNTNMQMGKVDRALSNYVVDASSLQQKNTKTGKVRKIRRELYDADDIEEDAVWQYSGDGKDWWASYDSAASAAIEHAHQNSNQQLSLNIGSATYTIDLSAMTQTRSDTNKVRPIRRNVLSSSYLRQAAGMQNMQVVGCDSSDDDQEEMCEEEEEYDEDDTSITWQFRGDDGWTVYDRKISRAIEQAFQNGSGRISLSMNGASYDIDIFNNIQTRKDTQKVRKIRRKCDDESSSSDESDDEDQELGWQYFDNGNWVDYDDGAAKYLEGQFQNGSTSCTLSTNNAKYKIDLVKMTQKRRGTGKVRRIRRNAGRPSSAMSTTSERSLSPLITEEERFIIALQTHTWLYANNDGRDAVNLKWKGISITRVEKIQSRPLWTRYQTKMNGISDVALPSLSRAIRTTDLQSDYHAVMGLDMKKETLLFHGTKLDNIDGIKQNGIDMNKANAGLYGKTIYLADCCQKADQYSDDKQNRRDKNLAMILCRALLGKVGLYSGVSAISGFDSTIGGTAEASWRRFYEFMIHDETQIYPAFVIYYNRV